MALYCIKYNKQKTINRGEMAEWLKAHAWKVCVLLKVPRVRIPVSPPKFKNYLKKTFYLFFGD